MAFIQRCSPLTVPGTIPKSPFQYKTRTEKRNDIVNNQAGEKMGRGENGEGIVHYNPALADLLP